MTSPLLHYPARPHGKSRPNTSLSQRTSPPWAAAQRSGMRTGACIGAAIVGGMGLTAGCAAVAVNWLLAVETQASNLLGAAEWAARVTMLGLVAGGVAGGVVGALVDLAMRAMRRGNQQRLSLPGPARMARR